MLNIGGVGVLALGEGSTINQILKSKKRETDALPEPQGRYNNGPRPLKIAPKAITKGPKAIILYTFGVQAQSFTVPRL